ncbi:hypothetical protein FTW19_05800 [Terriglobus albidus]|uniref:DUF5666 domain-containing protein n=1 Tax=Terriglobus albidus TaxID=1592106 RepID=A0A5B9E5N9_9BACT|nr:hypothetical protein [Terriglobus albidus]QEE27562.1 hypothetical protein FTW19_05800 [Terriglobus albidus]
MNTRTTLVTTLLAMASFTLVAQQSPSTSQPDQQSDSPPTRQNPASTAPAAPDSQDANTAAASSAPLSPVNGELVSKLDSKTAKNGDSVVIQTRTPAKTADGADIPKGSKLVGHVLGVKASEGGQNSQVVLQFDHLELKGGQSVPVHSQIQSITPAGGAASSGRSGAMSAPPASGTSSPGAASSGDSSAGAAQSPSSNAAASAGGGDSPAAGSPAPGTVVAKTGNIAISTTSVPGVLLANNAPGQQDPRMAQASSILLGAKQDIQLDSGTQLVVGISSAAGGGTQ